MLLSEAKQILKKNGYRLVEAYDAVTDHRKTKPHPDSKYVYGLTNNLARALKENGYDVSLYGGSDNIKLVKDGQEWSIFVSLSRQSNYREIDDSDIEGPESGRLSNHSYHENTFELGITNPFTHKTVWQRFDVRNVPGMVAWIQENV